MDDPLVADIDILQGRHILDHEEAGGDNVVLQEEDMVLERVVQSLLVHDKSKDTLAAEVDDHQICYTPDSEGENIDVVAVLDLDIVQE